MEEVIQTFDEKLYISQMEQFEKAIGLVFTGKASRLSADEIEMRINT